jgi:hypothetical protein
MVIKSSTAEYLSILFHVLDIAKKVKTHGGYKVFWNVCVYPLYDFLINDEE